MGAGDGAVGLVYTTRLDGTVAPIDGRCMSIVGPNVAEGRRERYLYAFGGLLIGTGVDDGRNVSYDSLNGAGVRNPAPVRDRHGYRKR